MHSIHLCDVCVKIKNLEGCLMCRCPKLSTGLDCHWCDEFRITDEDREKWKADPANQPFEVVSRVVSQ